MRWGVPEILDHSAGAVDLERLNDIGVLLFNHDTNRVIGKIVSASIENSRGIAVVEMDADAFSQEIKAKVDSGTLKGVSVRAKVGSWEEVSAGSTSCDGRFQGPCDIAKKWEPIEISIVSIPADASVGVGRSEEKPKEENWEMGTENTTVQKEAEVTVTAPAEKPAEVAKAETITKEDLKREIEIERARVAEIQSLCREFDLDDSKFIADGTQIEDVRKSVLEELKKTKAPSSVKITKDEGDKFRDAATDGLLLRAGVPVKEPAAGANEYRNMRLRDLMNICARQEGVSMPEAMNVEDLMRQFFTPSAAFPAILDAAANKSYVAGYQSYAATFEEWTAKGTLSDFKPTKGYRFGSAGELILVPEGGEIKHDKLSEEALPDRQLKTYGRQFSLTREAIYNDDYGIVTSLPMRYAEAARKTRNRQVYNILSSNPIIYDGVNLFDATTHGNLITPGTAPSMASVQQAIKMMSLQKDFEGNMIHARPRYILCPVGLGDYFRQIIASTTIAVTVNGVIQTQNNPLYGRGIDVIEDPTLNVGNANGEIEWYLMADKNSVPVLQVDYLNGIEVPTIRRMEYPGQLGFIWDIILDWGITVLDYRGIVKNEGSAT